MLDYELQYSDLRSFCPQWHDIFVDGALEFRARSAAPRILDCGGNVGLASLFFKRRFPGARITAYEADPAIFAMLKANLAANRASDVETVHAALWTANGRVTRARGLRGSPALPSKGSGWMTSRSGPERPLATR